MQRPEKATLLIRPADKLPGCAVFPRAKCENCVSVSKGRSPRDSYEGTFKLTMRRIAARQQLERVSRTHLRPALESRYTSREMMFLMIGELLLHRQPLGQRYNATS